MNKRTWVTVLLASALLAGCDSSSNARAVNESSHSKKEASRAGYLKPGAAIRFSHNLRGPLKPNQQLTVDLTFKVAQSSGQLMLQLQADTGLDTGTPTEDYVFNLDGEQPIVIQQTISAQASGKYYLTMFAEVMDGQGQSKNRVFALAVQVGDRGKVALDQSKTEAAANLGAVNLGAVNLGASNLGASNLRGANPEVSNLKNKLSSNQRRFTPAIEAKSTEQQLIMLPAQETVIQ